MSKWKNYIGKSVLVTGASSGIGLALSHELARRGANLILVARSVDKLEAVAEEIRTLGRTADVFISDLSVVGAGSALYTAIKNKGLKVDLLINNAGYGRWGKFTNFQLDDYGKMIQLNIVALTDLCHLFIPDMVQRGIGGVINVGSIASFGPVPYANVYSSAKAYVLNFTEALNYEYRDQGLQIMALCPGGTTSNFAATAKSNTKSAESSSTDSQGASAYLSAEEVAKQCLNAFLKDKVYVITGRSNKLMHAISRHLPRKTMLNLSGSLFKRVAESN